MHKTIILLALLCVTTFAQDKPQPKAADKPVAAPVSLDLTAKEIEAGAPLDNELARLSADEAKALNRIFTAQNDDQILAGAYKWREALLRKEGAQKKYDAWLESVRKSRDCEKCELDISTPGKPRLKAPAKEK